MSHSTSTGDPLTENSIDASVWFVAAGGPEVMSGTGASVSIVHPYWTGSPVLPAASVGVTVNERRPCPSPVYCRVCPGVQSEAAPPSRLHAKVTSGSSLEV
jgi:hypothetical protein